MGRVSVLFRSHRYKPTIRYACGLQIPDEVFDNPALKKLGRIGVEIQMLQVTSVVFWVQIVLLTEGSTNDSVSYHQEKDQDCPHNVIHLFHHHSMSEQAASDKAQGMLRERYREVSDALTTISSISILLRRMIHSDTEYIQESRFDLHPTVLYRSCGPTGLG